MEIVYQEGGRELTKEDRDQASRCCQEHHGELGPCVCVHPGTVALIDGGGGDDKWVAIDHAGYCGQTPVRSCTEHESLDDQEEERRRRRDGNGDPSG